jgi:CheY-like chemotaxis protein
VATARLDGIRVLLVDDFVDMLDVLRVAFEQAGAAVLAASSGADALELLASERVDLLISDIAMPDLDGVDLLRAVRARRPNGNGDVPAIALSAYSRWTDRDRTRAAGFATHIAKPVDPFEVVRVAAELIGSRP